MKNIILFLLISSASYSQNIGISKEDSIKMKKKDISIFTEMYIEEVCPNCRVISSVIDDENTIYLQCTTVKNVFCNFTDTRFIYSYRLTFKIKNNHCKAVISDVTCISVYGNKDCKCIQPNSEYTLSTMIDKESFDNLMMKLKSELDKQVADYQRYLIEKGEL